MLTVKSLLKLSIRENSQKTPMKRGIKAAFFIDVLQ